MNASVHSPSPPAPVDEDLAEQARPGHGIPSQDPDPAAQQPMESGEGQREADAALAGGGVMVGAAAGAAIGSVVAGPVGAVVGGTVGAVAGAVGGAAVGTLTHADDPEAGGTPPLDKRTPAP